MKKVSVVIPCRNEERHIKSCIESILANGYPKEDIEILVVDGQSDDRTIEIISDLQKTFKQVKLFNNPKRLTPFALNIGVFSAEHEHILIASAHSSFEKNYIKILMNAMYDLEKASAVGGVMDTRIKTSTKTSESIKEVLTHPFGVGNSTFRTGTNNTINVDTVPFGLYKTKEMVELGGYNELLIRNHDMELSKRILKKGGKIYLVSEARCNYYARENYSAICKNNFNNGKWNILTVFITKTFSSLSIRHFIPLFFLLSIFVPAVISIWSTCFVFLSVLSIMLYVLAMSYFAFKIKNKKTNLLYLLIAFSSLHVSYGIGSLYGFLSIPFIKRK